MYLDKLKLAKNKEEKLLIIGLGQENSQFLNWLITVFKYPASSIVIADKNQINSKIFEGCQKHTGDDYLDALNMYKYSFVVKAPGIWSEKKEFVNYRNANGQDSIISSLTFFVEQAKSQIVLITGTKGKTTTSSLIEHFLSKESDKNIEYCGNTTNISPYNFWTTQDPIFDNYIFVLEVSSFQLQDLGNTKLAAKYSVITNLYVDHLDQHADEQEYWQAKDNIFKYQGSDDNIIMSNQAYQNILSRQIIIKSQLMVVKDKDVIDFKNRYKTKLIGDHNIYNILLSYNIVQKILNHSFDLQRNLDTFIAPKGRLELVKKTIIDGKNIVFYNDHAATEPDAVMAAINALSQELDSVIILIISGKWKKGNHQALADLILKKQELGQIINVQYFGQVGEVIQKLQGITNPVSRSLKGFISNQIELTKLINAGNTNKKINILFSPSGSSFDEFTNYIERSEEYMKWVNSF
jgi:UDP-N-acetylmuramoylalanine--D-glutamate ligase